MEISLYRTVLPARLSVEADGELQLNVEAVALGAGYVAYLVTRLSPILDEVDYAWVEPPEFAAIERELGVTLATYSGSGNVANLASVTGAEVETIVNALGANPNKPLVRLPASGKVRICSRTGTTGSTSGTVG